MSSGDKEYRKALFFENVAQVEESNNQNDGRTKLEVNLFSLLNNEEKKAYLGFDSKKKNLKSKKPLLTHKKLRKVRRRRGSLRRRKKRKSRKPKKRTGALQYFATSYDSLNSYEKNWVNYWLNEFAWLDGYL